jgi:hypothetical protein
MVSLKSLAKAVGELVQLPLLGYASIYTGRSGTCYIESTMLIIELQATCTHTISFCSHAGTADLLCPVSPFYTLPFSCTHPLWQILRSTTSSRPPPLLIHPRPCRRLSSSSQASVTPSATPSRSPTYFQPSLRCPLCPTSKRRR